MVKIEGTITPSSFLPAGEVIVVDRSPFIDRLIRNGFVRVVEDTAPDPGPVVPDGPVPVSDGGGVSGRMLVGEAVEVPSRSGSKAAWQQYLDHRGIEWREDMSRDDLIVLADDHG